MNKKPLILILMVLLIFSVVLTSCKNDENNVKTDSPIQTDNNSTPDDDKTVKEKVYRFSDASDAQSLNAHNDVNTLLQDILNYTHSGLYRIVPNEDITAAIYIGDIAEGDPVKIDEEGYVWRINLRKDAIWHNGEPINADTFMYSYKMLIDPNLVNSMAKFFYDNFITIENAQEYYQQGQEGAPKVDWEDVGIKKVDDYAFEITTTQRYTAELVKRHFSDRSMFPVYEPYYEAGMNDSRTVTTYGTNLNSYMGCGPYKFERWNPDADRLYVKNHDHWLIDYFNYDKVESRITADSNSRVQMFENGELDIMELNSAMLDKYRDDPRTRTYLGITPTHLDINSINTKNPVLSTLNFRKAMFYAMDRETIAELVGAEPAAYYISNQAGAYPEKGITYRMTPEAQSIVPENYGYNPELAKEYFDKALEEVNETSVKVELMYSDSSTGSKLIGEYLQQALADIFGKDKFTLTMRSVPSSNYSAMKNHKEDPNSFDLAFGGWGASLSRVYPYAAMQYFVSSYDSRPNSYVTERFDQQFEACKTEEVRLNPELMVKETAELEKIYLEDVINVPLYQQPYYYIYSDRLILPFDEYVPGFGYGTMFGDIAE